MLLLVGCGSACSAARDGGFLRVPPSFQAARPGEGAFCSVGFQPAGAGGAALVARLAQRRLPDTPERANYKKKHTTVNSVNSVNSWERGRSLTTLASCARIAPPAILALFSLKR